MVSYILLLLPLLTQASAFSNSRCPEGWVDASTLGMGCLHLLQQPLDWESAEALCKVMGGAHLVEIDNPDQLAFLQQGLNFVDGTSWVSHHYWWTAANDRDLEGDWVWSNSDFVVQDFLWASDQPNNCPPSTIGVCSGDENCGALVSPGGDIAEYKMVDIGCDLSVVHNHHAPSYDIYSVCQINDY